MLGKKIIDNKPLSGEVARQVRQEALRVIKDRRQKNSKTQPDRVSKSVVLNF